MTTTRPRRIVRSALIALAGVVLLMSGYIAAWFALPCAAYHGLIAWESVDRLDRSLYGPLVSYLEADLPGSESIGGLYWAMNEQYIAPDGFF